MEYELGAGEDAAYVECYAVPLRPGSSRRRSRWVFLVVTDVAERTVREAFVHMDVEAIERRGARRVLAAWPRDGSNGSI